MARPYEVLTFDCYGTLIDWAHGIGEAFARAAASRGREVDRRQVLALYAEVEPQVQAEAYRPYREVLAEAAVRVAARLGWPLSHGEAGFLAESLPAWPPFPDTVLAGG